MKKSIRMLHFADLHLGMENYGKPDPETGRSSREKDFLNRLDELVDASLDCDIVIFAGDAFKDREPTPTQLSEFGKRIKRMADRIPVILLVGNHDMPGNPSAANSIDIFQSLEINNVIVGNRPGGQVVNTPSGDVFVAWLPYPMKNRLATIDGLQDATMDKMRRRMRTWITQSFNDLSEMADQHDMPRVFTGHFSVDTANYGSERLATLGDDVPVYLDALKESAFDYIALGHIHRFQDLNKSGYPAIVYSGSPERVDFGEAKQPKGYVIVDLKRGDTSYEFMPLNARPFVVINADLKNESDPTAAAIKAIRAVGPGSSSVVKLKATVSEANANAFNIKKIKSEFSFSYFTIAKTIDRARRMRLGDVDAETMTTAEILEQFWTATGKGKPDIERLIKLAAKIIGDGK